MWNLETVLRAGFGRYVCLPPAKCQGNQMPHVFPLVLRQSVLTGISIFSGMGQKHFISRKLAFRLFVTLWERHKDLISWEIIFLFHAYATPHFPVLSTPLLSCWMKVGGKTTVFSGKVIAALIFEKKQSCESSEQAMLYGYRTCGIWVIEKNEVRFA